MASKSVWVKVEGEDDEKVQEFSVQGDMTLSALQRILYADPVFGFAPGTIDCLLVRGEDGEKVALFLAFAYVAGSEQP
jgi:hypothetical protein